ncbi:ATP-binding protein [Actinosynnema sp. NPDC047251]|uniref:ATP-binding protein n=1 Tax=Saccharothrix espanaensis TaxID=103731 RepID=UPI0002EBD302|nr:ATP-binding protein [Saccharothrix espanaensis]
MAEAARTFELGLADRPPVNRVRGWVAQALPDLHPDLLDDLCLVVTELVSNAYDHTHRPVALRMTHRPSGVLVEVDDKSSDPPTKGVSRISDTRGRGLVIVAALALAWGSTGWPETTHGPGKTVWAELAHTVP